MAERLKSRLLDQQKLADLVIGPDAYRDLPRIIAAVQVPHISPNSLFGVPVFFCLVAPQGACSPQTAFIVDVRGWTIRKRDDSQRGPTCFGIAAAGW
jgi:tRNA-2-methylthio-N6-dimethylallyladenosine synthase